MASSVHPTQPHEVSITERDGEWHVVVRDGDGEHAQSFGRHEFALSYADGQRIRLGIEEVSGAI